MRALILCGGESKRMGFDKSQLLIGNKKAFQYFYDLFHDKFKLETYISCRKEQVNLFNNISCLFDPDQSNGPLSGILSAIDIFPNDPLLIIAVDLFKIKSEHIAHLINKHSDSWQATAYMDENQKIFPLLTILESSLFHSIREEFKTERKSLKAVLHEAKCQVLEIKDSDSLRGFNTIEEYEKNFKV